MLHTEPLGCVLRNATRPLCCENGRESVGLCSPGAHQLLRVTSQCKDAVHVRQMGLLVQRQPFQWAGLVGGMCSKREHRVCCGTHLSGAVCAVCIVALLSAFGSCGSVYKRVTRNTMRCGARKLRRPGCLGVRISPLHYVCGSSLTGILLCRLWRSLGLAQRWFVREAEIIWVIPALTGEF